MRSLLVAASPRAAGAQVTARRSQPNSARCPTFAQGIPLGTANSVFQASVVVSGLWGIYYKELEGAKAITLFFVASAVFMGGILLDALYGGSDDEGSGDAR